MDVTAETFHVDVLERSRERPVVVDFWADWCGPCHALAPVLERAVAERDGDVVLAKVDVDANPDLANQFGVRGIPAVKAFRNGTVVAEFVGARPAATVGAFLDELTSPSEAERLFAELEQRGELTDVATAYRAGQPDRVLELLLGRVEASAEQERDALRRLMVALFGELGHEHPLTVQYRRRLATALY